MANEATEPQIHRTETSNKPTNLTTTMDCYPHTNAAARAPSTGSEGDDGLERESKPGRTINFAEKLHLVLSNKECQDAVSWLPSGRSFCITSKEKFVNTILPKFFKSRANFNSFERRLKTWGFSKLDASSKVHVFSHESFDQKTHAPEELDDEGSGDSFNVMKQLRILLSNPEFQNFIWWLPSGESFCVSSTSDLSSKVLFQYFGETQFKTFVATLKRVGFKRVKTSEYFGEAVYSHELFRMGRPDLCSRMCRGNMTGVQVSSAVQAMGGNSLTGSFLVPSATSNGMGNSMYPTAAGAATSASMSSLQGTMNMNQLASRSNTSANFPIPLNDGGSTQLSGTQGMSAAGIAPSPYSLMNTYSQEGLRSTNPFSFSRMDHSSLMNDVQRKPSFSGLAPSNNMREALLLRQNQILQGSRGSSSLIQQQPQFAGLAAARASANAAAASQERTGIQDQMMSNMLSRRHSLLTGGQIRQQHSDLRQSDVDESHLALLNRRNSAPAAHIHAHAQATQQDGAARGADVTKMSILEIEDELLRVKEMKLMMMKRKLQTQLSDDSKQGN